MFAAVNGITDYAFTAEQNTQLLNLLKEGKLVNPDYIPPTSASTDPTESSSSTEATQPSTEAPESSGKLIYLVPGDSWKTDEPSFAAYFFNDAGEIAWAVMSDNNGDGRFVADIPVGDWPNVIFCRLDPDYIGGWNTETVNKVWNQTVDLVPEGNCFTITDPWSVDNDNKALGTWSDFEESLYYPASDSSINTFYDALASIGIDNSKANRTRIAIANGIVDYAFTAVQNDALLALLEAGKLINPEYKGEIPVNPIDGVDIGSKFTAFVYNLTSWKLLTPDANGNAIINEKKGDGFQLLTFEKDTDGSYKIYTSDRRYLTVEANSAASGANIKFASYSGASGQKWSIQGEDGKYKLQAWCAPACHLEVYGDNTANGTNIQNGSTTTGNEQFFQIIMYDGTYVRTGYENGYVASGKDGSAGTGKIVAKGIDVSKHNEKDGSDEYPAGFETAEFNFEGIKNAGYDYVIIRAGSTNKGEDPMFDKYYEKAKAAGLDVGAYFYSYALTAEQAGSDAKKFLSYIEGKKFEYPVYLDFEENTQAALDVETSKTVCLTFMTMMANEGYLTGIYTGISMANGMNMDDICESYESWIARYYDTDGSTWSPTYSKLYGMYQYYDKCSVPNSTWTDAVMDVNYSYKDYPSIVKQYGFNGYSQGSWSSDGKFVFADGSTATGWFEYDGKQYYFDDKGEPVNGWVESFDTWHYFDMDGILSKTSDSVIGDVDVSSELDIKDVTYIQKILARYIEETDALVSIGDVNGNGRLDIRDATYIQLYLGKFIDFFKTLVL